METRIIKPWPSGGEPYSMRLYAPVMVESHCPKCGQRETVWAAEDGLFPINDQQDVWFWCHMCYERWDEVIYASVDLKVLEK